MLNIYILKLQCVVSVDPSWKERNYNSCVHTVHDARPMHHLQLSLDLSFFLLWGLKTQSQSVFFFCEVKWQLSQKMLHYWHLRLFSWFGHLMPPGCLLLKAVQVHPSGQKRSRAGPGLTGWVSDKQKKKDGWHLCSLFVLHIHLFKVSFSLRSTKHFYSTNSLSLGPR